MTSDDLSTGLLDGVRVLDLSDEATALAGRLLGDLGATVVRVEDRRGDALRMREPAIDVDDANGAARVERGWAHLLYNQAKLSLAVDFDDPSVWQAVEAMLPRFDVLIAPLTATGALAAWLSRGAAGEWAHEIPVVDCVFRRSDAYGGALGGVEEPVVDLTAMAAGGHVVLNGLPDDPPVWPGGNLAYKQASITAAEAALALVTQRRRGGGWSRVVVGMQEAVTFTTLQTANGNYYPWHGHSPDRHTPIGAMATFQSADGHWISFTIHPPHWPRFVDWADDVLGAEPLRDPKFDDEAYRNQNSAEIRPWVERMCAALTVEELFTGGQARGLLVLPIQSVEEVAQDPHLTAREFYQTVDHPQLGRDLRLARPAVRWRGHQPRPRRAPRLGEDSAAVLRALGGWSEAEIAAAAAAGRIAVVDNGGGEEGAADTASRLPLSDETSRTSYVNTNGASAPPPRRPLEGVRVLDFCWAIAGSLGTRLLADLGADVMKVESEARLDPIRYIGVQPPDVFTLNTNGVFNDCSANKRALTLNLSTPEGIETIRALAKQVDVVTSNYTPFRLDRWGLGYDDLRQIKDDIIVCNVAVMGIEGPRTEWRSYGSGIVGMSGLAWRSGFGNRPPHGLGTLHTDFTVPYYLASSVMAALDHRNRTGDGRYLELAQYETATQLLDTDLIEVLNGVPERPRGGNRSPFAAPHGVFPAQADDRWLALACPDDSQWRALCRVIARPDLAMRDDLATLAGRQAAEDEIEAAITEWSSGRDEWTATRQLLSAGIPASPVERLADFFEQDPGMRGNYARVASGEAGVNLRIQHEPILWDGERLAVRRAPLWGEHTEAVLAELLGYGDDDLTRLAAAGALG